MDKKNVNYLVAEPTLFELSKEHTFYISQFSSQSLVDAADTEPSDIELFATHTTENGKHVFDGIKTLSQLPPKFLPVYIKFRELWSEAATKN
jgi:hypothetical protein